MANYCKIIAKSLIKNADGIIDAIDKYLAKADEDLSDELKKEGYADAKGTVEEINSLEDEVVNILQEQTDTFVATLAAVESAEWDEVNQRVTEMLAEDTVAEQVETVAQNMFTTTVPRFATVYMQESDGELVVETLRNRTAAWITQWSKKLGELTKITTHEQITNLIQNTIANGESIATLTRQIMDGGWRSEYYQAKRFALTEVLRAHSVAREEAIQQSPAIEQKEWRHTGSHKNKPRPNHVDMDRQVVPKDQPFELKGKDGTMYYPMYPRDSILPAGESVNCHCIHRGIVSKEVLGLSSDERRQMQQAAIDSDNGAYARELDAENKEKAGITAYNAMDNFREKPRDKQIKYIGGKAKMALYDAGLVPDEEMLKKVKNSTLQELAEDGIFTVDSSALRHSTVGEFTRVANPKKPAGGKNGGNLAKGGHSQSNIDELSARGISYQIEQTYDNGVRIGGVADHKEPEKRLGKTGQSWFPESWDDDKVRVAGTYTVNHPGITIEHRNVDGELTGYEIYQSYDGVTVGIFTDPNHNVGTIFPDGIQREVGDSNG